MGKVWYCGMNLIDCNNLKVEQFRTYGGLTGPKLGVWYNGKLYMLKMQQSVRRHNLNNVEISYANDPISEYIGSHFYEICGVDSHETLLGEYNGKLCVLCRDYSYPDKIIEFREWRNRIVNENVTQYFSGMSSRISDIMEVIKNVKEIDRQDVRQRFWDMFVMDAIIGNTDRNNGNWGFYVCDEELRLYPVYDCGGCLNNKKSDKQMTEILMSDKFYDYAFNFTTVYKDYRGHRINPLHYIRDNVTKEIEIAIGKLPDSLAEVNWMIQYLEPIISKVRIEWYQQIIKERHNLIKSYAGRYTDTRESSVGVMNRFNKAASKMV